MFINRFFTIFLSLSVSFNFLNLNYEEAYKAKKK